MVQAFDTQACGSNAQNSRKGWADSSLILGPLQTLFPLLQSFKFTTLSRVTPDPKGERSFSIHRHGNLSHPTISHQAVAGPFGKWCSVSMPLKRPDR